MLRLFAQAAQVGLIALAGYNAVIALWGWRNRIAAPAGPRTRKLRVVIPAHNEEPVIGSILADLAANDYSSQETWVLADRCTDMTVQIARESGAETAERSDGPDGKGAALAWYLGEHPLTADETLVVFDADTRVPSNVLNRIADEIDAGHPVVQCYLDVANPDESLIAEASALSYWAGNRMVQLARSNLGWSADLGGTGMALTAPALTEAGGFGSSLTEDQELGARLVLAGMRVEWLHDIHVNDRKPASVEVAIRQRSRWMAGKRVTARKHIRPLLGSGNMVAFDQALRLIQPGRSFVALLSGLFTVVAVITQSSWLLPWPVWAAATAVQVLEPIPFLAREGVTAGRLVRYPVLVLIAGLWTPIRILSRQFEGWYHTPR